MSSSLWLNSADCTIGMQWDDARGLCPPGWHVSTDAEWTTLEEYAICEGFEGNEGNALKSTAGWSPYISNGVLLTGNGTDDFGFFRAPRWFFALVGPGLFLWEQWPLVECDSE